MGPDGRYIPVSLHYTLAPPCEAPMDGVEIIDAAALLDRDPSVYFDFCHPGVNGHRRIAELLVGAPAPHVARLVREGSRQRANA